MESTKKMRSFGDSEASQQEMTKSEAPQQVVVSTSGDRRHRGCLGKILCIVLICGLIVLIPSIACSSCFRCGGCGSCGGRKTGCISCGGSSKAGCGKSSQGCGKSGGCNGKGCVNISLF